MTKNYELDNNLTRLGARAPYAGYNHAAPARDTHGARAVAFAGLPTNRIPPGLPGADFARLLPHLEPVELACDENLYFLADPPDFVYFPENAVVSHLYILRS